MAVRFVVLLAALSAVAAVPHKALIKRPNYDFIEYYNCAGKPNGNYIHPTDCTRFISCSNGNAADMACPDCGLQNNPGQCAGSEYLVYDASVDRCEWPATTECVVDPHEPEPTPPTDAPSEPEPTSAPVTDAPVDPEPTSAPVTDAPAEPEPTDAPSTDAPAPEPTDAPATDAPAPEPKDCKSIVEGSECSKDDCEHCGYCEKLQSHYFRCQRVVPDDPKLNVTGHYVKESCDGDLWWNPNKKPTGVEIGGACDLWANLSEEVQKGYKEDPECVDPTDHEHCEYGQDEADRCTDRYWFKDPAKGNAREDLKCSEGLIYDVASETCRDRKNVSGC